MRRRGALSSRPFFDGLGAVTTTEVVSGGQRGGGGGALGFRDCGGLRRC
jgi:hypothetical protein